MNFLLHRHLAATELGSEEAGLGAMLPDVWRMADRRARARRETRGGTTPPASLGAGVEHHLDADLWFHRTRFHDEGERLAQRVLAASRSSAPKLVLFGHVVWEMALDGALVRREGTAVVAAQVRGALARSLTALPSLGEDSGALRALASDGERERFHRRVAHLLEEIGRGPWIHGYADGEGLCDRLSGVRSRFGLPPLVGDERARIAEALDELVGHAAGALPGLLAERAREVSGTAAG